jgi:hypothetical protein
MRLSCKYCPFIRVELIYILRSDVFLNAEPSFQCFLIQHFQTDRPRTHKLVACR